MNRKGGEEKGRKRKIPYFLSSAPSPKICGEHLSYDSGEKVGG